MLIRRHWITLQILALGTLQILALGTLKVLTLAILKILALGPLKILTLGTLIKIIWPLKTVIGIRPGVTIVGIWHWVKVMTGPRLAVVEMIPR